MDVDKNKKLASEYSKLRAQAGVLKRAVIDEQNKNSTLKETLKLKDQVSLGTKNYATLGLSKISFSENLNYDSSHYPPSSDNLIRKKVICFILNLFFQE